MANDITTQWLEESNQVLHTTFAETWTQQDIEYDAQQLADLLATINQPVALIVSLPRTLRLSPTGFHQQFRHMVAIHQRFRFPTITYVTRVPDTITLFSEMIAVLAPDPSRYQFVRSMQEAKTLIDMR